MKRSFIFMEGHFRYVDVIYTMNGALALIHCK